MIFKRKIVNETMDEFVLSKEGIFKHDGDKIIIENQDIGKCTLLNTVDGCGGEFPEQL